MKPPRLFSDYAWLQSITDGGSQCQSVTSVVLPCQSHAPVEMKVVWHATANCPRMYFAQNAITMSDLRDGGVPAPRLFVYPTLLSFCTSHLTDCFSRAAMQDRFTDRVIGNEKLLSFEKKKH